MDEFNKVKKDILNVIEVNPENIQHIGSTSIPGLSAKPIIDVLLGVDNYETMPETFFNALKSIGIYRLKVERDDEIVLAKFEDHTFEKHTHFVHLVSLGGQKWTDLLKFRDYLRAHEHAKDEYMTLKYKLLEQFAGNRSQYTKQKETFIKSIINAV
ncbi:GrpB family protein [Macrococcus lamae]|uniref:GrpB family protein n=1 Tax=Macrococcus lamae TaxID=198484 RepID=UPI002442AF12|nr:GrpB family protein [Macrococcus lamae]